MIRAANLQTARETRSLRAARSALVWTGARASEGGEAGSLVSMVIAMLVSPLLTGQVGAVGDMTFKLEHQSRPGRPSLEHESSMRATIGKTGRDGFESLPHDIQTVAEDVRIGGPTLHGHTIGSKLGRLKGLGKMSKQMA